MQRHILLFVTGYLSFHGWHRMWVSWSACINNCPFLFCHTRFKLGVLCACVFCSFLCHTVSHNTPQINTFSQQAKDVVHHRSSISYGCVSSVRWLSMRVLGSSYKLFLLFVLLSFGRTPYAMVHKTKKIICTMCVVLHCGGVFFSSFCG